MSFPTSLHAAKEMLRMKTSGNEYARLVHEATNEDPWGPTGEQMDNVCRVFQAGTVKIMEEIKLRLKNRDKSWRPCYKALLLLDHLARNVPEVGLPPLCSILPTLQHISQTFYYTGKQGADHGLSVRERAKKLFDLLSDPATLRDERYKAAATRAKLSGESIGSNMYGGYGSSQFQGGSNATQPSNTFQHASTTSYTISREQQEQEDRELAARMQREEERRAGITVSEAQRMLGLERRSNAAKEASEKADMELAKRLEEEERRRAFGGVGAAPSEIKATAPPEDNISSNAVEAHPKAEPRHDMLDDLFASAPAAPVTATAPPNAFSMPAQQQAASVDPFGGFTSNNAQQLQTHQQWPQQQQQWPQQQQQWPQQHQQWPQHQQQQWPQQPSQTQFPYANSQPLAAPLQQPAGVPSGGGWYNMPPTAQQTQSPPLSQAMPTAQSGMWSSGAPHSAVGMGMGAPQGYAPFDNMGTGVTQLNTMEQQIAQFAGQNSGFPQPSSTSLDGIMAGRRLGQ
ncbi:epsin, putative [Trypanosoma equiperdum]|uniref:Epsin, putative n=1 Tax=Trypanosoma equiperdum TaxID=5694 RepID=A0A1G4HZX9_TRYEQ|nr:epsin, putative [Trypanosoma equiperdum]